MTVNQWLAMVGACVGIYLASTFLPSPDGSGWFTYQAIWSTCAIWVVLRISTSKPAIFISLIELSAIIINTIAYTDYMRGGGLFYQYCVEAHIVLNVIEAFVLVIGAPWNGMASLFRPLGVGHLFRNTNRLRSLQDSVSHQREISCKSK